MSGFFNTIKSFVHSISTSDHYASYDPSRPSGQEDTTPLATGDADRRASSSSSNGTGYVPGMRSAQMSASSTNSAPGNSRRNSEGGTNRQDSIPLSDIGPIPSPELSWSRIDAWVESNYPELYDQLMEGATSNDLNDSEHDLDCVLPPDVRESLSVHDGQEPGGKPTGLFFGIALLDMESISEEWNVWRRTASKIEEMAHRRRQAGAAKVASSSAVPRNANNGALGWVDNQGSCPPDTVQPVYAHTAWIPLAKDYDGNNIGIDLAPGPKGRYGQVISFGRDFDVKYVVAPSWGDFLSQFAADLESGQSYIDDDIENAVFAFKAPSGQLVSYFNVMRQRVERTQPKSASQQQRPVQPRTMSGHGVSVSHAPVNSGRPTQRLISPTGSTTSLASKDSRQRPRTPSSLANQLNEVDLHGENAPAFKANTVPHHEESAKLVKKPEEHTEKPATSKETKEVADKPAKPVEKLDKDTQQKKEESNQNEGQDDKPNEKQENQSEDTIETTEQDNDKDTAASTSSTSSEKPPKEELSKEEHTEQKKEDVTVDSDQAEDLTIADPDDANNDVDTSAKESTHKASAEASQQTHKKKNKKKGKN